MISIKHDMGTWKALMVFILLVMYFTIFSVVVAMTNELQEEQYISVDGEFIYNETYSSYKDLPEPGLCDRPRNVYNPVTGDYRQVEVSTMRELSSLSCEYVAEKENECNNFDGCSWEEETADSWRNLWGLLSSGETYYKCDGTINFEQFNITAVGRGGFPPYTTYENFSDISDNETYAVAYFDFDEPLHPFKRSRTNIICLHESILYEEDKCEAFGCTWIGVDELEENVSAWDNVNTIRGSLLNMLTFNFDFGIENNFLATIINLLFIGIPLTIAVFVFLMIIINIVRALPFT